MSLTNGVTDRFDIVRSEEAKGLFRLFSRNLSSSDGFCLVIFRKESYLGSIISNEVITENDLKRRCERIGVRDGDSILRINMGPRPMTITEKLTTQDGYTRAYKLEIEVYVNDARTFAQRYRQVSDPVNLARIAIEGFLQRYAARNLHDDLREDMLLNGAMQALTNGSNRSFGLGVKAAHKVTLWMDPLRAKELDILQKAHLEEQRIREEARIKKIEVQEGAKVREEEVRGDADVGRLKIGFNQELQSLATEYERLEDVKRTQHEMDQEAYLLREKNKQRKIVRVDEIDEKDHQIELETKQDGYLRLKVGQDNHLRREEEAKEDEHVATQSRFKIEREGEQRYLTRAEEIKERRHELILVAMLEAARRQQGLLSTISERSIEALSERISDRIEGGEKLSIVINEVFGDYPELRDIFLVSNNSEGRNGEQISKQIEDATKQSIPSPLTEMHQASDNTVPSNSNRSDGEGLKGVATSDRYSDYVGKNTHNNPEVESIEEVQDTSSLPGILRQQDSTINITDLGITLLQIELEEKQREIASTYTSTAFVISALTDAGPAKYASLTTGDIVVEIDGQELANAQAISRILKAYKPSTTVAFCILRGEELLNVDVRGVG